MTITRETKPKLPDNVVAVLRPLAQAITADYSANTKAKEAFLTCKSKAKYATICNYKTSKGLLADYLANKPVLIGAVIGMVMTSLKVQLASTGSTIEVEEFDFSQVEGL
mgnify:CR=1 FL=1